MVKLHDRLKAQYRNFFRGPTGAMTLLFRRWVRAVNDALWKDEEVRRSLQNSLHANALQMARTASHLRAVFEAFPDIFLVIDQQGLILETSGTALDELGRPAWEWIGKTLAEFPNSDIGRRLHEALTHARRTRETGSLEFGFLGTRGMLFYEARLRSAVDDQAVLIARDITARRNALDALKSSEERYAIAAQAANDGLFDWHLPSDRIFSRPDGKASWGSLKRSLKTIPKPGGTAFIRTTRSWCCSRSTIWAAKATTRWKFNTASATVTTGTDGSPPGA
ncbi:MAG: PAS domain-containing protein [Elusimicrobia bacterium]|nr:PAS domain-containing protein [Elusimicrobiota bacterium]